MFVVHYFENKILLLSQYVQRVPSVGEDIKIKGRKGKVTSVTNIDEKNIHLQVTLANIVKPTIDNSKKKKR